MYVIGTCKSPGDILVSCDRHLNMQRTSHIIHSRHYCTVEKLVARVRNVNMQEISQGSEERKGTDCEKLVLLSKPLLNDLLSHEPIAFQRTIGR